MLKREKKGKGKGTQTEEEIDLLKDTISKYRNRFGLKSFTTRVAQDSKKHTCTGGGAGAGAGGASLADSVELRAHGY